MHRRVFGKAYNVQVAGRSDQVGEPGGRSSAAAGPGQRLPCQGETGSPQYRSLSFVAVNWFRRIPRSQNVTTMRLAISRLFLSYKKILHIIYDHRVSHQKYILCE